MIYMGEEEERLSKVFDAISKILSLLIVFSFIPILIRTFTAITPKYRETISITSLEDLTDYMTENVEYSLMYPLLLTSQDILTDYLSETINVTLWLDGWNYRKNIIISGSESGDVTDYQIRLTVHYGSGEDSGEHIYLGGNCRTDFGDVRFTDTDGVTLLPYWIEEKVDGNYAILWVKVPYIPAYPDTAIIYIYYGNPDATSISNGDATFIFFDDFTTLNLNKWTIESGSATVENGELKLVGSATFNNIRANLDLDTSLGYEWNYKARVNATNNGWGSYLFYVNTSNTYRYVHRDYYYTTLNQTRLAVYIGGALSDVTSYISPPRDTLYHKMKVRKHGNNWVILWDNYIGSGSHAPPWTTGKAVTFHTEVNFAGTVWVDYVFIRNYISPEPSITVWGSEESL